MPKRKGKQLNVTVLNCKGLKAGKSDRNVVVQLQVEDLVATTKVVSGTLDPVFNEDFSVVLTSMSAPDLHLTVVDKVGDKEESLGIMKIALGLLEDSPAKHKVYKLERPNFTVEVEGEIEIQIEYSHKVDLDPDEAPTFKKSAHVTKKKGGILEAMFKELDTVKKVSNEQEKRLEVAEPAVKQLTRKVKDREEVMKKTEAGATALDNLVKLEQKNETLISHLKATKDQLETAESALLRKDKQIMQLEKVVERNRGMARQASMRASALEQDKAAAEEQLSAAFAAMGPLSTGDDDGDDDEESEDEEIDSGLVEDVDENITGDASKWKKQADSYQRKFEKEMKVKLEWKDKCAELEALYNEMLLNKQAGQGDNDTQAKLEQMEGLREQNEELKITVKLTESQLEEAMKKYRKEAKERKKLYNEIQELKGNIRVYCRCRPISSKELERGTHDVTSFGELDDVTIFADDGTKKRFEFDSCFDPNTTQEKVFEDTQPLMQSVMDGFNVCMFAYGQTGSGKTFTMQGPVENPGVNMRALIELFRLVAEKGADYEFEMDISVLEIYCESIKDLLSEPVQADLKVRQEKRGKRVFNVVDQLTKRNIRTVEDVQKIIELANKNRSTSSTSMNAASSRSHLVMSVDVATIDKLSGKKTQSALHMIDLAGSERVGRSEVTGQALKEAQAINQSLSALGNVLAALGRGDNHVPYRNSKLTHVLADALGGNSKVLMFCNISPASDNVSETLSSLQFASRARQVELGKATANVGNSAEEPAELADDDDEPPKTPTSGRGSGSRAKTGSAKAATPSSGARGRTATTRTAPAAKKTPVGRAAASSTRKVGASPRTGPSPRAGRAARTSLRK